MSETEQGVWRGLKVAVVMLGVLFVLRVLEIIPKPIQAGMAQAGMISREEKVVELPPPSLNQQDFRTLVYCVREIGSIGDVVVPGSEMPGGKYLSFGVTFSYTIELRLEDKKGVLGAMVYRRDGKKIGWVGSVPPSDELTEVDFVRWATVMLDGPCTASALAQLGS